MTAGRSAFRALLLPLVFALSYSQAPLYTSNQNSYFVRGLAAGGFGLLSADWLAATADPVPLFSWLVRVTYVYGHPALFHLYFIALLAVYMYSLLGIASTVLDAGRSGRLHFAIFLTLAVLHSPVTGRLTESGLGFNPARLVQQGVATQFLLGPVLQPSVFGVLLLLSLHLFLADRLPLAAGCAAIAAAIHPTYLLSASLLFGSYAVIAVRTGGAGRRLLVACAAFLLPVASIAAYTLLTFGPVAASSSGAAADVLFERIPHHADPRTWFDAGCVVRLLAIVIALQLVRRTRLAVVMAVSLGGALSLTLLQLVSGDRRLALLFPWRPSTYLVPLSFALIVAWGLSALDRRFARRAEGTGAWSGFVVASALLALTASGLATYALRQAAQRSTPEQQLLRFVKETRRPGDRYLVPLELERFRLATGAPIFVDWKSHPYRADELLEWDARIREVRRLRADDQAAGCLRLRRLAASYELTHVVLPVGGELHCDFLAPTHEDAAFALYAISPESPEMKAARITIEDTALALAAVLGLSFWFWLGFPFGHHNESYAWAVQLDRFNLVEALTQRFDSVATFRPGAQALAWLGYHLSQRSTIPAQLGNYLLAAAAWIVLLRTRPAQGRFALSALLANAVFFSGFIYLFHLHGVFYSPLLLLIALVFPVLERPRGALAGVILGALAAIASLFHPFAWVLGGAAALGLGLEQARRGMARGAAVSLAAGGAMTAVATWIFATPELAVAELPDRLHSALVSYRMLEPNWGASLVALAFALWSASRLPVPRAVRAAAAVVTLLVALPLFRAGIPLVLEWIALSLVGALLARQLGLAALVVATAILPLAAPTGSPTYAVFAVMVCVGLAAITPGGIADERLRAWVRRAMPPLLVAAVAAIALLRAGAPVPILARLARPLLAERERTRQLETVLDWLRGSEHAGQRVRLEQPSTSPSLASDPLDRTRRAPTSQSYLDQYVAFLMPAARDGAGEVVLRFGARVCELGGPVLILEGQAAGAAVLCASAGDSSPATGGR